MQGSSQWQSASVEQVAPTLGSAAALEAGAAPPGAAATPEAPAPGARATDSLGLAAEAVFGAVGGASPAAEGGLGVEQATKSASAGAVRSMIERYQLGGAG